MTDNPLKFDADRDERIRARAYHLWESEEKPHGRAVEFWKPRSRIIWASFPAYRPTRASGGRRPRLTRAAKEAGPRA
jgi:hypothetical protein